MRRVALFLSCDSYESFFGGMFGLDRAAYVETYRNDFAWDYARGLVSLGHAVTIYVLSRGPAERRSAEPGLDVRFIHLPAWHRVTDAIMFRARSLPRARVLREGLAHAAFMPELRRALAEDAIDLLYVQEFWSRRFDLLVRDLALPIIGADHGGRFEPGSEKAKARTFARAPLLTCQDEAQFEQARALGGNAVLLRNGVDVGFYQPAGDPADRPRNILAVGRLVDPQKRFSDLLRAMPMLPEFTLTLAGSGPDRAMLQDLADKLDIADRVTFAGFVGDRAVLRSLYQQCGVFVSSSAWEAVALVMLEAMSAGAAIVGTRIAAFASLIEDGVNGRLVPLGDPAALAGAVRDAYALRCRLGENARRTVVEGYTAEATYGRLSELIEAA